MAKSKKAKPKGFKNVAKAIAKKQGISQQAANKILGKATATNPKLKSRAAAGRRRASKRGK